MIDETEAEIDSTQLIKRLEKLGITADITTLQKWSKQGLIPEYETGHQHRQMKRGRPKNAKKSKKGRAKKPEDRIRQKGLPGLRSKWPPEAVEEAAAVWAVQYHNRDCKGNAVSLSVTPKILETVRLIANSPRPYYKIRDDRMMPDMRWPDVLSDPFTYRDLETKLAKDDKIHRLAVTYIAALEKARRGISVREPKLVVLKQDVLESRHLTPFEKSRVKTLNARRKPILRKGQELTPAAERLHEKIVERYLERASISCVQMDIDLEPTDATCDEIVHKVRRLGSKRWVDSRKYAIRSE